MNFFIALGPIFSVVTANIIKTEYRLTSGNGSPDIIQHLLRDCRNVDSVGIRVMGNNPEMIEELDHNWMENRDYDGEYSYFEKFEVEIQFQPPMTKEKNLYINVPGPLPVGAKVSLDFALNVTTEDGACSINIMEHSIDNTFPTDMVMVHTFLDTDMIKFHAFMNNIWTTHYAIYFFKRSEFTGVKTLMAEVTADRVEATLDGQYTAEIPQSPPGDSWTGIYSTGGMNFHGMSYSRQQKQ